MSDANVLDRLTAICSALPESGVDDGHPPHRGFTVGKKHFAWYAENEHDSGRVALTIRAEANENEALVASDPERFGLPKYVARHGWVNYFLDLPDHPIDWDEVNEFVRDSFRIQAPRRLAQKLDG